MDVVYSVNGILVRFTEERWLHIADNKPYMQGHYESVLRAIENPTWILRGYSRTLVAVLPIAKYDYLHVVYKELDVEDGFIITAFISRKVNKRMIIWP